MEEELMSICAQVKEIEKQRAVMILEDDQKKSAVATCPIPLSHSSNNK